MRKYFATLQNQVLWAIVGIAVGVLVLFSIPMRLILLNSFIQLEEQAIERDVQRALNEITDILEGVGAFAADYARWDDTYNFMADHNPAYLETNYVATTYIENRLDAIVLVHPDGALAYGQAFDQQAATFLPLPEALQQFAPTHPLVDFSSDEGEATGLIMLPDSPMFIAARPILTSNGEGPRRGVLMMGRRFDENEMARLCETTALAVSVAFLEVAGSTPELRAARDTLLAGNASILVRTLDEQTIGGYALISDIYERPVLLLYIHAPREIYAQGKTTFAYLISAILFIALVLGITTHSLLARIILKPLSMFSAQVTQIGDRGATGDFTRRIAIEGENELSRLGLDINAMLDNLQVYQKALLTQKQHFAALVAVARATGERPTLDSTLKNALEVARSLVCAERGSLFLLDEIGAVTYSLLARAGATPAQQKVLVEKVMQSGLAGWVSQHREPALISDTALDPRWVDLPNAPYVARSALVLPILSGARKIGILTLTHPEANHFGQSDLELIQAAADQMALAIRNAQIYEDQSRLTERQTTLYAVLNTLSGQLDRATLLRVAVEATVRWTGWNSVAIFLHDAAADSLVVRASAGERPIPVGWWLPMTEGVIGRAFREGHTQYVANIQYDPDYVAYHDTTGCELSVPLRGGGQVLGVLNIEQELALAFRADDIVLAESLADTIVLALTNAELFQTVSEHRGRLQALIESSQDGIILIGANLKVLVINAAAVEYLALSGAPHDWVDQTMMTFLNALRFPAPEAARTLLHELRRPTAGAGSGSGEVSVAERALHWLNLPVRNDDTSLGQLIVLRDITDERLLARMRDDLTHTMVHDLRNPLTGIFSALKLLQSRVRADFSADMQKMLEIALNSAQRMLQLVNAILDISRLENGQMPIEPTRIALAPLVEEVLRLQIPLAASNHVYLEAAIPPVLPDVHADRALVERICQNLVGNAIKFTPEGGKIRIVAWTDSARPAKVCVAISDTGPGIAPEIRDHLFEKFTTGKQRGRGTGLGLAFCKMALAAHGEDIWVESTGKQGTTFTFTLPIVEEPASEEIEGR
ncbi:MAG TPA: CHASE4 domain-containing protein [Anaerolineae bacterium]|nr:CHASE4 domain-containing protein [Anaerolineae bacterium]